VSDSETPLYGRDEAAALRRREADRAADDDEKLALLLDRLGDCRRLVDIGCGWGQLLGKVAAALPDAELWGADESPDRTKDLAEVCPGAKVVVCRADRLELPEAYFDAAVTSQVLHEVKLFGGAAPLSATLRGIRRCLAPGGRYLLLDHQDAGSGETIVSLPPAAMEKLTEFESRFRFYGASHQDAPGGAVRLSRRCLQDFLTKAWSLGTPMEPMEMNETHNVFRRVETERLLSEAGFAVREWIDFADITADLARVGGRLIEGRPWCRKFLAAAVKR
jgi:SAM-dependent methyltransferase